MGVLLCNRMQQMVNKMTTYHTHRSQLVCVENFWVAKFLHAGMVRESTLAKGLVERDLQTFQPIPGLLQWVGLQAFVDGSGTGRNIWKLFAISHLASVYSVLTIPACLHIYTWLLFMFHLRVYILCGTCLEFLPLPFLSSFCSQTQYACLGWTDQSSWFRDSRSFGKGPTRISGMTSFLTWHAWYVRVLTNWLLIWHMESAPALYPDLTLTQNTYGVGFSHGWGLLCMKWMQHFVRICNGSPPPGS